jgi:hypothetical protein
MGNVQRKRKAIQNKKTSNKSKTYPNSILPNNQMKKERFLDGHPQLQIMEEILLLAKLFGFILASLIIQAL